MTRFVIDANIIISILISGKAAYKPLLSLYEFYTSEFSLEEIEKYKPLIFEKSRLNAIELRNFAIFVYGNLTVLPNLVVSREAFQKAVQLTHNIDIKDVSYVSLALELDLVLLTRDRVLATGLRKKGFRKVMLFEDFLSNF